MALVQAPLLSLDASGSVAGALVYSKWKGRSYVRSLVKPANPRSGGQVGVRAAFKFLSQQWASVAGGLQQSWEEAAEQGVFSEFNAYMKGNLLRNRNFLAMSQDADYPEVIVVDAIDAFAAVAGVRQITIELSDADIVSGNWGFLLYRALSTGFTPAFDNLIAVVPTTFAVSTFYVDTPLVPDEYFYDAKPFTRDGVLGVLKGEISDTVL